MAAPHARPAGSSVDGAVDDAATAAPLALHDVRAGYGRIEVLHGIDLDGRSGARSTALLGPNGAGKTTTLGVMSGLLTPTSGCRHVEGRHLNGAGADELARIGVCHIREGRSVFPNLSVADNLIVAASCGASLDRRPRGGLHPVPAARGPPDAAGRHALGRREADARPGPRPRHRPGGAARRRAVDGPGAARSSASSTRRWPRSPRAGVSVLVVEQFATIGLRFAVHRVRDGPRRRRPTPARATAPSTPSHAAYLGAASA